MLNMYGTYVGVVQSKKEEPSATPSLFKPPESSNNQGTVKYLSPEVTHLKVGDKVYFGNTRELIQILGENVLVMKADNIYASISSNV